MSINTLLITLKELNERNVVFFEESVVFMKSDFFIKQKLHTFYILCKGLFNPLICCKYIKPEFVSEASIHSIPLLKNGISTYITL